jgi:hypothetical protein
MTLSHNIIRANCDCCKWRCIDCGRAGTIAHINSVKCPKPDTSDENLLGAITGEGKYSKTNVAIVGLKVDRYGFPILAPVAALAIHYCEVCKRHTDYTIEHNIAICNVCNRAYTS